jgi:hypothetical protein
METLEFLKQFELPPLPKKGSLNILCCANQATQTVSYLNELGYTVTLSDPKNAFPILPFPSGSFDLALCSYFLFTESNTLTRLMHQQILLELCRVANEVQIFPLFDKSGELSSHIGPLLQYFHQGDVQIEIKKVAYSGRPGENAMLRIYKKSCTVVL